MTTRRRFLSASLSLATVAGGAGFGPQRIAFAGAATDSADARFVFILLRGALDGLAAVPPYGDSDYAALRREFAIAKPGAPSGALALDGDFGLHPRLEFIHGCYRAREAVIVHAVASPYRERSHFDGQDVLENGAVRPHAIDTGWINRAIAAQPASGPTRRERGIALGQNLPLAMRGPAPVASWAPSTLAAIDDDTLERIADLYAQDGLLSSRLADALAADDIAGELPAGAAPHGAKRRGAGAAARFAESARAAGSFLARPDGPRIAMLDTTGWDTHANEGAAEGQLATRLEALDRALAAMQRALGSAWSRTIIVIATEFGRTAAPNGTRGTDHGTGSAAFILGGAIQGGRVLADWPGLARGSLYEGRDLAPTIDLRAVLKGLLGEHLGVSGSTLDRDVFPDSASARAVRDLVRG